jgi:hypothetical protein
MKQGSKASTVCSERSPQSFAVVTKRAYFFWTKMRRRTQNDMIYFNSKSETNQYFCIRFNFNFWLTPCATIHQDGETGYDPNFQFG